MNHTVISSLHTSSPNPSSSSLPSITSPSLLSSHNDYISSSSSSVSQNTPNIHRTSSSSSSSTLTPSSSSISNTIHKIAVNLIPLYGNNGEAYVSSLLIINNIRILLDCGWNENFDIQTIAPLRSIIDEHGKGIDAVIISQPDLAHCGALPYLYSTLKCTAPIYMTIPIMLLGSLAIYDAYLAHNEEYNKSSSTNTSSTSITNNSITAFTLENVKETFETALYGGYVHTLRYLEEISFSTENIILSPSNSGYMLGGSVWRISRGTETILYAPVFNHKNEKHLAKASLQTLFRSPSALITSSYSGIELLDKQQAPQPPLPPPIPGEKDPLGKELVDTCLRSLRVGGHVLIPCDTVGRVLELLIRLDMLWGMQYHYPIYYLNYVAPNVIDRVNTVLEYMIDKITREFTDARIAPFDFRPERSRIRVTTNIQDILTTANTTPIIVLTSFTNMNLGPARQLFTNWVGDARNTILLTSKDNLIHNSITSQLFSHDGTPPSSVIVESFTTVPLTGLELKRYKEAQAEETLRAARAVALERMRSEEAAEMAEATNVLGTASNGILSPTSSSIVRLSSNNDNNMIIDDAHAANNEMMTPVSPALMISTSSTNTLDQQQRTLVSSSSMDIDSGAATMDNEYTDDEDTINHLDYIDDALSYSVKGRNNTSSSITSSLGLIHRQKGLIGRFPMFAKDEHFSLAATQRLQQQNKDKTTNKVNNEELTKLSNFRSVYTDYGQTINAMEFEETESEKVATGSGIAYGTMAQVHTGLPSAIAAQLKAQGGPNASTGTAPSNEEQIPTKRVRITTTLRVSCKLRYISFEGRSDAKSLLNVIESITPLKIVYIHGTSANSNALVNSSTRFCSSVYAPTVGQSVDLSSNTSAISIKVNGSYFASLGLTSLGSHNIGFINADIQRIHELGNVNDSNALSTINTNNNLIKINNFGIAENITLSHPENEKHALLMEGHNPVYLRPGPLRAAEIRRQLAMIGIESTIIDGVVVTQNGVLIKRIDQEISKSSHSTSDVPNTVVPNGYGLEIEGPAIPEYFQIRKILYNFYTML